MVQFVFVHGVATRPGEPGYANAVANRDKLFRGVAFKGRAVDIRNAKWGDVAQTWAWDQACLPMKADRQRIASFSLSEGLSGGGDETVSSNLASSLAKTDFPATMDIAYAAMVEKANEDGVELTADEVAEFADAAEAFRRNAAGQQTMPASVSVASNDELAAEIRNQGPQSYGFVDSLSGALDWVVGKGRNLASTGLVDLFRDDLNPLVARFIGDVFVYLKQGDQREAIRTRVRDDLMAAFQGKAPGESLVVMGHSMGGVILYDMLSDPQGAGLPADFKVDLFVTVGSQPGFFEELKLFAASSPDYAKAKGNKAPMPGRAAHWLNVFDPVDLLSFRCGDIFEGVRDLQFSSVTGLVSAHTAYFGRPQFHERLRARLDELHLK